MVVLFEAFIPSCSVYHGLHYVGKVIHPPTMNSNDWFNVWISVVEEITIGFQTLRILNKVLRPSVARHVVAAPVQVLILRQHTSK